MHYLRCIMNGGGLRWIHNNLSQGVLVTLSNILQGAGADSCIILNQS